MSYPLDVAAQNAGLKAFFGDDHAVTVPSTWEIAQFTTLPALGGVELDADGGYARETVANTTANFPNPVGGQIVMTPIAWAAPTGAWSDSATAFVLIDAADSTTRWFAGLLADEISITEAQPGFEVAPAIKWNTEGL